MNFQTVNLSLQLTSSQNRPKAQYDTRAAILVDSLESRACLSTILAYTCHQEDAEILIRRLCKKGEIFLERDSGVLKSLCVPRSPKKEVITRNKLNKTILNVQRSLIA